MTQSLGCVGRQVKHIIKPILGEKLIQQFIIENGPLVEANSWRDVIRETTGKIIQSNDIISVSQKRLHNMRTNKSSGAGDENRHAHVSRVADPHAMGRNAQALRLSPRQTMLKKRLIPILNQRRQGLLENAS